MLKNIFQSNKSKEEKVIFNWKPLTEITQLEELLKLSNSELVVVFKHSTRCGISRSVLSKFEKTTPSTEENVAFYYLDLLTYRTISNEISNRFNVYHQSPQVILLKDEKIVTHQSHYDIISALNLEDYI